MGDVVAMDVTVPVLGVVLEGTKTLTEKGLAMPPPDSVTVYSLASAKNVHCPALVAVKGLASEVPELSLYRVAAPPP
tara:strand:+ start:1877 stop:2107 length:231 start_codon:yes stop_codon:yes gene_type:complete